MKRFRFVFFFILISCHNITYSQTKVKGRITDNYQNAVPYVNILVQTRDSVSSIITYTYSNDSGSFLLELDKDGNYDLVISALGFKKKILPLQVIGDKREIEKNISLEEQIFELDEVIVQSNLPISVKKDTITFNAQNFLRGNEVVIEDLLRNLPGINVDIEGRITIGNREIEKLMIDGDDLFEKGYKILSKSMPVHPVETIELLKNYSNNRLLKGIEESNKVALNLKLKDEAKNIWFGNLLLGYDLEFNDKYYLKGNLANFSKKYKYYFITNANNTGDDVTGDINQLIKPYRFNEPASIGDNQAIMSLNNLSSNVPGFKSSRVNFNNSELTSLNTVIKLSDNTKLKTLILFNGDENDFFRNSVQSFGGNGTNFVNTENFTLRKAKKTVFGKIDLISKISKTKNLQTTTKFNYAVIDDSSDFTFNNVSTNQYLETNNVLFDQKINYTNKFSEKKVFLITARYIKEKSPQNYLINRFFYEDLFPEFSNANNVFQSSENNYQFAGFETHLLDRKKNGNLLELKLGNELRIDNLKSTFNINQQDILLGQPDGFQNNVNYSTNDLYFKAKYLLKINQFGFIGSLNFHQLFNYLSFSNESINEKAFFINPKFTVDWKINEKNKISVATGFSTKNVGVLATLDNFSLVGFRSFRKGTSGFNQLGSSNYNINYQLGDFGGLFFANFSANYNKDNDFLSTNTLIDRNFSLTETILTNNRKSFNVSSDIDYYLKSIKSNFKVNFGHSVSDFKNIVNDSGFRTIDSNISNYGITLRSGYKGFFNYHFGTNWRTNKIQSGSFNNKFSDNMNFLDLTFLFSDNFNFDLKGERYLFGNTQSTNTYHFLDISSRYVVKKNKVTLFLDARNLLNTSRFQNFSISDISTSTTEYRLLPRFFILKFEYRF